MFERRKTRTVEVGNVKMGSGHPVVIQSMTKTDTADAALTAGQIRLLEKAGCEIVRLSVKDMRSAEAVEDIKKETTIPMVADIHFDHKLALEAIRRGADKIRINPGNMQKEQDVAEVIDAAKEKKIPIRVGINSGSLLEKVTGKTATADAMVASLVKYLEYFRKRDFNDIVVSLKASDVKTTVEAYRKASDECDYPFHLGVTAAGPPRDGVVRSSVGIGTLLMEGIGDTIRVSLTGDPVEEVDTAKRILSSTGSRRFGPDVISCPTCGRCQVDLISLVEELEKRLSADTGADLTIAVMGCEVNGPGEAKAADIGIAFGKGKGAIFKQGKIVKTVDASCAIDELLAMIGKEQEREL